MTKTELAANVAQKAGITKKDADSYLNVVFDVIKQALVEGDKVQIIGFGTFENRERSARKGRNPRNGEEIDIPASKLPSFKAGKALKEAVNP
ncbi:MAG: HU family DNA-binding protein [Selenomonadaceae bacterium]|nr:HU family DNA-binding protein [Selenomonadaceae bacterium]